MNDLRNKKVLITAGPTHEPIDPVRYIGNNSSGKMGYALAEKCRDQGAEVFLISGPTNLTDPDGVTTIRVTTAEEMYKGCLNVFPECDIAILAAAVADYRPEKVATRKIKKSEDDFILRLVKNKDIALELGKMKRKEQLTIGFALETDNEEGNARKKLAKKNFDFIILNSMNNKGAGFGHDTNQISIISHTKRTDFELKDKNQVAEDIIRHIKDHLSIHA